MLGESLELVCASCSVLGESLELVCTGCSVLGESLELVCASYSVLGESLELVCTGCSVLGESLELVCAGCCVLGESLKLICTSCSVLGESLKLVCYSGAFVQPAQCCTGIRRIALDSARLLEHQPCLGLKSTPSVPAADGCVRQWYADAAAGRVWSAVGGNHAYPCGNPA